MIWRVQVLLFGESKKKAREGWGLKNGMYDIITANMVKMPFCEYSVAA